MTELLGMIAAIILSCSGSNANCGLQADARPQLAPQLAHEYSLPAGEVPKPAVKPQRRTASKVPAPKIQRPVVASAEPRQVIQIVRHKPIPIFIGAYF